MGENYHVISMGNSQVFGERCGACWSCVEPIYIHLVSWSSSYEGSNPERWDNTYRTAGH
jgi:hypothetical protein